MTGSTTTVGIEVRAEGTQKAARDLADVDASLKKINAGLGGTAQPAGAAAQGLSGVGASAKKAAQGLGSVSKFASTAKFDKIVSDLGAMGVKLNTSSLHAQKLARAMQQVERERAFQQLAADANLSTLQLAKFRAELGDTRGALATLSNGLGLSKAAMLAFAAAVAFGGKACLDAALQADRLSKAYTTITGSSASAQQQLSYLYDVSNRLGLQFQSTAEAAKTFFAAGKGTSLEKDMNAIFEAVSSAGAALSLSTDDMHGAFIALGQMISKGKVQAEELRGQLGERLPGAFQLAAKAMGMTTAQLDKFMADGKLTAEDLLPKLAKVMQEDFGAAAEAAAYGLQGQMNRLSTEWTKLKANIIDSGSVADSIGLLAKAMKMLADHGESIASVIGKGLQWAVWATGVYAFIKSIAGLIAVFQTLRAVSGALSFAGIAAAAGPVAAALGLVLTGVTSLVMAQDTGAEIGKRYASVSSDIEAALKKQAQAAKDARDNTDRLSESQKRLSVSQAIEDQARALQEIQSLSTGKGWLELLGIEEADENILKIKEKALELLTAVRTGQGDVSQFVFEIDKLGTTSDKAAAFAAKLIEEVIRAEKAGKTAGGQFVIVTDAARGLARAAAEAKAELSSPWSINIDDAQKGIDAMRKNIRSMQAEVLGMKHSKQLVDLFPNISVEKLEQAKRAFKDQGWVGAVQSLGNEFQKLSEKEQIALHNSFLWDKRQEEQIVVTEKWRKAQREAAKDHRQDLEVYNAEIGKTKASITSLQAQLAAPKGALFKQEEAKIAAEYEATLEQINKQAGEYARKKGITKTQIEELKNEKLKEAALKKQLDLRKAQEKEEKRLADLARDKYEFYKELEEITGQYGLSLKYQSEVIEAQVKELERLKIPQEYINQWRELKELQASHEWADGARRAFLQYRADATDAAKGAEEAFSSLYSGMDSGWKSAWQQMIETGKMSLSSFRSLFASFLADLLHMAITRPITVQIAGVVSGMFGAGGVAQAAGGAGGGGIGNLSGLTTLLPTSWTSGIADTINNTMAGWFPGTFAMSGAAGTVMTPVVGAADIAGLKAAEAALLGGNAGGGMAASGGTFLSAVSPYLMAGGLGSLGYSMLGGALGLPQSKYSGLTAGLGGAAGFGLGSLAAGSAMMAGTSLAAGAALGSVIPVAGTIIGAIGGGLIGSMFGKTKTHPSVYTNVPEASLVGTDWAEAFKQGAWGHRMSAGEIDPFFDEIGGYANSTAQTLLSFAQSLPEAYAAGVTENLKKQTVGMGRGTTAGRGRVENRGPSAWDLQFYDDEHTERAYRTTQQDIARVMLQGLAESMEDAGANIRDIFPDLNLRASNADLAESDEWTNAVAGLTAIQGIQDAIKNIDGERMTQAEQQAKAFVEQLEALSSAVASYGVDKDYADRLLDEYRAAYVDSYVKSLEEMFHPLSQVEQQAKGYKEAIDGYVKALETMQASEAQLAKVRGYTQTAIDNIISSLESSLSPLSAYEQAQQNANAVIDQHLAALRQLGASEGEIARVEALRAEAVAQATAELLRSFEQNVAQRWAALDGASDEVGRAISQENELREAVLKFGEGSAQVAELLKLHAAETAKAAEEAAKAVQEAARSEYDALKSQMDALEQQRVQLRQQAIQKEISALNEQLSAAKTLRNTWEGLDKSLGQARYNLFAGAANLDAENRLGTVQAEFRRLSGLALGGDSEAAGQLAGVGNSLLDLVKQTAGTEEEYLDAFWAVNAQLRNAQDVAGAQVSSADKQLEALQGQLDVQNAALEALQGQSATLEEIEKQIAALRPLLEAAADKAGIKAFASGGLALPGWALVGEKGPELVNFSQPGRVYTAADTAALFRSATPRAAEAGSREEVRALREEVYQLRRDTLISMSEIARFSRRTADMIEAWDKEGMPGVRA